VQSSRGWGIKEIMEYKDIRTGQRVVLPGGLSGEVVEVDPRRLGTGDPVRVRIHLPITGTHALWVEPSQLTPGS